MAFVVSTLEELHEFAIAHYKSLNPDDDVSEMSLNWLWLLTLAAAVTDNHAHLKSLKTDLFPGTALGDMLVAWADLRGVVRKPATASRGSACYRVFGTALTSVPAYPGTPELVHVSGERFKISATTVVGPAGYVDCDLVSVGVGSKTKLSKGEKLKFAAPVAGLSEEGELQKTLEEGADEESEGSLGARHKSRWRNPPLGGAQEDYVQWALAETGIETAFCYPLRRGNGSVHLAALHGGTGTARILDATEVAELQAKIDRKRPVSVKAFKVLQVVAQVVDVEYRYVTNGEVEHEPDWIDNPAPTAHAVTPWDAVTRKLQFSGPRPASMQAKDRIIISNGATGKERVIEALSGNDAVILEDDPSGDVPNAASTIYSGGPLTSKIREAFIALFNVLGTANKDSKRYGSWEGNLRPTALGRVATAVTGVLDGELVTPVATVEADDPPHPSTSIGLLVPGRLIARKKW